MGYSKHSLPRLGRCCVPLRGIATRRPFPRLASSGQPAPPPVCGYSRLAFAPTPTQYPQPIRKAAHGGAALCGSVRLCAPSFGLALSGYSPIIPGAVPGLCGGMEGREKGKGKAAHGGAALALFIHFQKLCKDNNGENDNTKSNQHFPTPLHESKPFRRGGFGKPISNGGGVLF